MTDKPDNQMERWLKEYAQRRRGELGEPFDLHEATRTMLQAEMRRLYGKPAEASPEPSGIPWLGWVLGGGSAHCHRADEPLPITQVRASTPALLGSGK